MTTKEKIQNKIDQVNGRINELLGERDGAGMTMTACENADTYGYKYRRAVDDYFYAQDKIDRLERVIINLEDYL